MLSKNKSFSLDARRKHIIVITGLETTVIKGMVVINDKTYETEIVLIEETKISPRCRHRLKT